MANFFTTMSKRQKQTFTLSVSLALAVILIAAVLYLMTGKQEYKLYENAQAGISLKYPASWKVVDNPGGGALAVFLSPKETALDAFIENVAIVIQDLPSEKAITLQEYTNRAVQQMTVVLKDKIEVVESSPATLSGRPAYRFVWKEKGVKENPLAVQMTNIWTIKNNRAYQITYGALISRHAKYLGIANTMFSSLEIR